MVQGTIHYTLLLARALILHLPLLLSYGLIACGEREGKATPLSHNPRTFDPDLPAHRLYQLLTDVETQASPSDGTSQIPLEPNKLPKKQRDIFGRNTRTAISHADTDLGAVPRAMGVRIAS